MNLRSEKASFWYEPIKSEITYGSLEERRFRKENLENLENKKIFKCDEIFIIFFFFTGSANATGFMVDENQRKYR